MNNEITVTLNQFPGVMTSVSVAPGTTWADVVSRANLPMDQISGRVSGVVMRPDSEFSENVTVLVTRSSKSARS